MKLKYHLDHPQIKRKKSWGNGNTPKSKGSQSKFLGSHTTKGEPIKGGTGNIKTNIGKLLGGK